MKIKVKFLFCKQCPGIGFALVKEDGELERLSASKCHNAWNEGSMQTLDIPVPTIDMLADLICESAPMTWAAHQDVDSAAAWEFKAHKALNDANYDGGRAKVVEKAIELAKKVDSTGGGPEEFPAPEDHDIGFELEALVNAVGELK